MTKEGTAPGAPDEDDALTPDEARRLTDELKDDIVAWYSKLLRLYEGGAHTALGYSSWAAYCEAEFGWSDAKAYRLLSAARVIGKLPIGSPQPANESVARELVPLLDDPERLGKAWREVVRCSGDSPTAKQVREVVRLRDSRSAAQAKLLDGVHSLNVLARITQRVEQAGGWRAYDDDQLADLERVRDEEVAAEHRRAAELDEMANLRVGVTSTAAILRRTPLRTFYDRRKASWPDKKVAAWLANMRSDAALIVQEVDALLAELAESPDLVDQQVALDAEQPGDGPLASPHPDG